MPFKMTSGGGASLSASQTAFLYSASTGVLLAALNDPYAGLGLGVTTYATFGTVPGQLALSGANINKGATAAVAGSAYALSVEATSGDGKRKVGETVVLTAEMQLTLSNVTNYSTTTVAGTKIADITGVPSGAAPVLSPNDGRMIISGSQAAGWTVLVGLSASAVGNITLSVVASGALSTSATIAVSDGSNPFPPLANPVIRPVANRTRQPYINTHGSDGVNNFGKFYSRHLVFPSWDCYGQIQLTYSNRCSEAAGFNSITVSCQIEYPFGSDVWYTATCAGLTSTTIGTASADSVFSVTLPDLGGGVQMHGGLYVGVQTDVTCAAGGKWPTMDWLSLSAAHGEGAILSTSFVTGHVTMPSDATEFYGPTSITGLSKAPRAILKVGDSIENGKDDTSTGDFIGYMDRVAGPNLPFLSIGTSGELAATFIATHDKRMADADRAGCTDAWVAYLTNDVFTGSYTNSQLVASYTAVCSILQARNYRITGFPILTRTNSTDNWVTAANQNFTSPLNFAAYEVGGQVDQVNTLLQGLLGTTIDVWIDHRTAWQDGNNKILVLAGDVSPTADGTHPAPSAHANLSGAFTLVQALYATTKAFAFESWPGLVGYYDAGDGASFPDAITGVETKWRNKAGGISEYLATPAAVTQALSRLIAQRNSFAGGIFTRGGTATTNSVMASDGAHAVDQMLAGTNKDFFYLDCFEITSALAATLVGWSEPLDATNVNQAGIVWRNGVASSVRYGKTGDVNLDVNVGTLAATLHVIAVKHVSGQTTAWVNNVTAPVVMNAPQAPSNAFGTPTFSIGNIQGALASPSWALTGLGGKFYTHLSASVIPSDAAIIQAITDIANKYGKVLS